MPQPLDCLVLGYDDDTPQLFTRLASALSTSVEARSFERNQVRLDGEPTTYMDVLNRLVGDQPAWRDRAEQPFYHVGEVTNLAALYLASYLEARGCTATPISLVSAERDAIVRTLEHDRPLVVAITTTFYEDTAAVAGLVQLVRAHHSAATVVVGGPLVQNLHHDLSADDFQAALATMAADVYVDEPEGEATLLAIVRARVAAAPLDDIANLFLPEGARYTPTRSVRETNVLDETAIDWSRVSDALVGRTVQTRTARSCAYHCAFCDYPIRAGRLSLASVEVVERELELLAARGVQHLVFVDDTFNVPHERFRDLCQMMIRRRFGFRWYSYLRCGSITSADTFPLMRASGCEGVFLGIESGDATVLRNMDKVATPERYLRGIEALHAEGILTFASFIAGFPGESAHSIANTIAFVNEARPTLYRVEPWWYNHRSPIHKRAAEFELTGRAYDWRHATMTASEACDAIDAIFQGVTGSYWCPQQSFSFWALPYLMGKGMSRAQVVAFHGLLHDRLPRVTGAGAMLVEERPLDALHAFASELTLSAPRFARSGARAGLA